MISGIYFSQALDNSTLRFYRYCPSTGKSLISAFALGIFFAVENFNRPIIPDHENYKKRFFYSCAMCGLGFILGLFTELFFFQMRSFHSRPCYA